MKRLVLTVVATLFVAHVAGAAQLQVRQDTDAGTITVHRVGEETPILTQNAREDFRPYIHPIVAPDGKGELTQYSPGHHPHQTGLYWGMTRVNGRDFFHHPEGTHWKRAGAMVLKPTSSQTDLNVRWQTIYQMLNEDGKPILVETQTWTMREENDGYILDLKWNALALEDITVSE